MPRLECSVDNCYYNKENKCCKTAIDISGQGAMTSAETCCNSYYERDEGLSNDSQSPNANLYVACHARKCVFNQDCHCEADSIDISGANACNCEETECSSFYQK